MQVVRTGRPLWLRFLSRSQRLACFKGYRLARSIIPVVLA